MEKLISLSELKNHQAKESYIVEGLITKGLTLIGGIPKSGKTFLALQMASCLTTSKEFIGMKCKKGTVIYIAFEDQEGDIDERFNRFGIDKNIDIQFRIGSKGNYFHLDKCIQEWKEEYPNLNAVFVDTYGKLRDSSNEKANYQDDYKQTSEIRELAVENDIAIILLHHLVKDCRKNSPFEAFYGTNGIPAAADNMMVLYRENIMSDTAELMITGKSIPMRSITIKQNERLLWEACDEEQDESLDVNIAKVINYISKEKKFNDTANELCSRIGLVVYPNQLSTLLSKNVEVLRKNNIAFSKGRGKKRWLELTLVDDSGADATME